MISSSPRILLIGGTYRALRVLEHLIERRERVVAFLGIESDPGHDCCAETLELCNRFSIPARAGRKLGEEIVRWLEDRIRPDLAIAVGMDVPIPLAIGGNCRLGLLEAVDRFQTRASPGVTLRRHGRIALERGVEGDRGAEDREDDFARVVEEVVECIGSFLDDLRAAKSDEPARVPFMIHSSSRVASRETEPPCGTRGSHAAPGCDTRRLEEEAGRYLGAEAVFALRSPTDAYRALGHSIGLRDGAEVIVPGVASTEVLLALRSLGARAVLVDVDPARLTIDVDRARAAIGPRTRAIVISHPFGQPAPIDLLYGLAEEHALEVIEDGGDSLGARFGESRIGRSPCACVFRLPAAASPGEESLALVALPEPWAERFEPEGKALRASDACSAMARSELARLEDTISERRANASFYSSELVPYDAFRVPVTPEDGLSTHAGYLLRLTRFARTSAADLARLLGESGIETQRLQLGISERELGALPCTDEALHTSLLLPVGPGLDDSQREHVLDSIFGYAIG